MNMPVKEITSSDNQTFRELKALLSAKGRAEQGRLLAEGPHLVQEALGAGMPISMVAVGASALGRHEELLDACAARGAQTLLLADRLLDALCDTRTPQGIVAAVGIPRLGLDWLDGREGRLAVVLENVQDPGNVGTILRTALAAEGAFALLCGGADPWSPKVVRASQGAVFHLPILEEEAASQAIERLKALGWHCACAHLAGQDFFARPRHARTALVIGNEGAGVSAQAAAACQGLYRLPMSAKAESLNAAVAAGIMLYDLWRETGK